MPRKRDSGTESQKTAEEEPVVDEERIDAADRQEGSSPAAEEAREESVGTSGRQAAEIAAAEQEIADLKDQLLRKQAEFENFRKRLARDKEESVKYANSALLADLIDVIDDFERAIRSSEEARDYDSFHEGIVLIERQLVSGLEKKWGLTRLDSLHQPFDPEIHHAIATEARADLDGQVVLEEFQKGYKLHDRVLRPATVKVSVPASSAEEANTADVAGPDAEQSAADKD